MKGGFVEERRGGDSVIGSVLMLSITVIPVTGISTVVFGMGNEITSTAVQVTCDLGSDVSFEVDGKELAYTIYDTGSCD